MGKNNIINNNPSVRWALVEARFSSTLYHHGTQTYGLCVMVLPQVKAAGLVRVSNPHLDDTSQTSQNYLPNTNVFSKGLSY